MKINWTGFSKKTPAERLEFLKAHELLQTENWQNLANQSHLPLETANQMSENVLSILALPYSIAPDFLIDGQVYQVPFVTEEPSVVLLLVLQQKSLSAMAVSKPKFIIGR